MSGIAQVKFGTCQKHLVLVKLDIKWWNKQLRNNNKTKKLAFEVKIRMQNLISIAKINVDNCIYCFKLSISS